MPKFNEFRILMAIKAYSYETRDETLKILKAEVAEFVKDEIAIQKVRVTTAEIDSEVAYAILMTLEDIKATQNYSIFTDTFKRYFRTQIRSFSNKRNYVDIDTVEIPDDNPNPEEAYALKEQIGIANSYLNQNYDEESVEMFVQHYGDGRSFDAIGETFGMSRQAIHKKVSPMFSRLTKHMKRVNNE